MDEDGNVKGHSLTRNVAQFDLEDDSDQKAVNNAFNDLNKQKIELLNKVETLKEKRDNK